MSVKWNGSIISVDCGSVLGVLEGEISSIDIDNQTISLINVSRNAVKCLVPMITLSTNDIKNLKLLKSSVSKEDTVSLNNSSEVSTFIPSAASNKECANSPLQDDNQKKRGSSKKKLAKISDNRKLQKERDEACFNAPMDSELLDTEFDFEKNLALFDKQKVFDEINALSKPDHIKLVDCNKRIGIAKYRHDENILSSFIPVSRQISVPCKIEKEYVTDSGLTVPSVTVDFKKLLFKRAEDVGFSFKCRLEMIGRAASELALQLLGGNHRLNPQNTHQRPTTVILSGSGIQGAQGVNCGRHLANHNVNVSVLSRLLKKGSHCLVTNEIDLFQLTDGKVVESTRDLPQTVDIIIDALSLHDQSKNTEEDWYYLAREWASTKSKATLIYLDPPPNCKCEEKNIILAPALPFPFENEKCSLNICDIGIPQGIFSNLGCSYSSPFGSKFIVTLYPKKDVI